MIALVVQVVPLSGRRSHRWMGGAMSEEVDGAKEFNTPVREFPPALLDSLRDALYALRPQTLFVTDIEMIRRIGVPEKIARAAIRVLDENPYSGFPKKSAVWGNRRYWPAVEIWFRKQQQLETEPDKASLQGKAGPQERRFKT
jgi:hypothetical protein